MAKRKAKSNDLLDRLQEQIHKSLNAEGIYSVLDYAWEGENTSADDYVGLAMWCTDAPFEPDWFAWNRTKPPSMPTKQDETFWEYSAGAALWLNIAADRIREYYVMARFGQTPDEYEAQDRRNSFMKPFCVYEADEAPKAKQAAFDLRSDAKKLEQRRNVRNKIVHEVASCQGRNALQSLKRQKEASSDAPFVPRTAADLLEEADRWPETSQAIQSERRSEMENAIADLKAWYLLAVHACALAVEYEYWKRKGQ
jgi:hypothetical protein